MTSAPPDEDVRKVQVRFHGALEDFLLPQRRGHLLTVSLSVAHARTHGLKDVLEALGPPHPELARVTLNGRELPLTHPLSARDLGSGEVPALIEAWPFEPVAGSGIGIGTGLAPPWPVPPRFLLDVHLGTLARHLRLLGLDTAWSAHADDDVLAAQSAEGEGRILLTRDVGLLKRSVVTHGYLPRSDDPRQQLDEVTERFSLRDHARPFTRCLRCNGLLEDVRAEEVAHLVPPRVRERQLAFRRCTACGQLYWAGTHHARLERLVDEVLHRNE